MKTLDLLRSIFFTGTTHYAVGTERDGTVSYAPVSGAPGLGLLAEHLRGATVLGSYTLRPDSTVTWICLDVDCTVLQKARNIATELSEKLGDYPHAIEFSGNKGYHVWIFLDKPVAAARAKAWGVRLRESVGAPTTGDPHVEVFPKQELLSSSSPMGNLVKLPLGLHPKTHNRSVFVDRFNGWETGTPIEPEALLSRLVDFEELEGALEDADPIIRILGLITPYWTEGERHNLCLALSGFLASLGWGQEDVQGLIDELVAGVGGDIDNLTVCVQDTYKRLAAGKTVQGFSGLNERLPVNVMRALSELAGNNIADPLIQIIDRIRMEKGTLHLKVRNVERAMLAQLRETGRFVKTHADDQSATLYWLNAETHQLLRCDGTAWKIMMHKRFGINTKESFSLQANAGLLLRAQNEADTAKVYKRFYWDGDRLWINFGGAEVYSLNGSKEERRVSFNGDNTFLFQSEGVGLHEEFSGANLFAADPIDPWKYLTNDLSFSTSEHIAADNEQQRQLLRAWILQMFFGQIAATRPIALLIGPRGSGKTTAARRILRFFEGFQEDVLGIADDKQDSLRSSLEQHLVLVLDNLEKIKAKWLDTFLNRLSTGAHIELRKLHTTNESYKLIPEVWVMCTGIEVPSSEESLYSRLLALEMDILARPKPEYYMQSLLRDNFVGAWAGMLNYLDSVIHELKVNTSVESPTASRLADFQVFCARVKGCTALDGEKLMAGLNSLVTTQHNVMSRNSPAVAALELWLNECAEQRLNTGGDKDPTEWRTSSDIFKILQKYARLHELRDFRWNTPAGFSRHFVHLVPNLEEAYRLEKQTTYDSVQGRDIQKYRFASYRV